jgi:hypothetical protein
VSGRSISCVCSQVSTDAMYILLSSTSQIVLTITVMSRTNCLTCELWFHVEDFNSLEQFFVLYWMNRTLSVVELYNTIIFGGAVNRNNIY